MASTERRYGLATRRALVFGVLLACAGACAGIGEQPEEREATRDLEQTITSACSTATFGLPCDPDGAAAATECQGMCWLNAQGNPACLPVAAIGMTVVDLNGRVCGDGVGADCTRSCENGACVQRNARVGSACRPDLLGASNTCTGACTLVGPLIVCQPAILPCLSYGRDGCSFNACDFQNNTTGCQSWDLQSGVVCSDGNSCTGNDRCNGVGACTPGSPVPGCVDGGTGGAAGTSGAGGATGGRGGSGTGGTADAAGGSAGSPAGGTTGANGAGGRGGSSGTDAGDGAAGASGATGSGGAGGTMDGAAGAAASSGIGGASGLGGASIDAGSDAPAQFLADYELQGGGCACRTATTGGTSNAWLWVLGAAMLVRARTQCSSRRWLRSKALALAGTIAAFFVFSAGNARAQGFAVDRYQGPVSPSDLFWVERADPGGGQGQPFTRLTVGYADDPLVAVNRSDDSDEVRVVDSQLGFYLSGGLVVVDRLQGALLLPVYLGTGTEAAVAAGVLDPEGAALGNPGLDLRFTVLDRSAPMELALAATARAPVGSSDRLAADDGPSVLPRVVVSRAFSERGYIAGTIGTLIRESQSLGDLEPGSELLFSLGALAPVTDSLGVTAELAGGTAYSNAFDTRHTPVEATAGMRWTRGPLVAGLGAGPGLTRGYGSPDLRVLATAGLIAEEERRAAPPLADSDPDRDGVKDPDDQCPNQPEDRDGFEDADGCPDPDNDRDGVLDGRDRCPNHAEDKDQWADDDGCPDLDNDADGIPDVHDRCPTDPEDKDGWQDQDGCPETDNDADSILDAKDKCPNEPETRNGKDDEDGCPDLVRVEKSQIRTLEPIYFEYDKARIQARSEPLLIEMANVIKARPDLGGISIEGHTDDRGNDQYNQKLSDARAQAVMKFLVDAGVPSARLQAKGFGESRPIDDNKTDAGRARNRRVEFLFVEQSGARP